MELKYNGATMDASTLKALLELSYKYKLLPSYVVSLLHYESMWGTSNVAKLNNNLGGMTWTGEPKRPSDVVVERGSNRPADEGGYYMRYKTISDFFEDWGYLLRPSGHYKVSGAPNFDESVKGMFKYGGAMYDYATMGVVDSKQRFELYLRGIKARRNAINQANDGYLDKLDNEYLGVENMAISAKAVLDTARKYMGTTKYSAGHHELLNKYNAHTPLARGTRMIAEWDWCAHFVSTVGIMTGQKDIISIREISVGYMLNAAKSLGIWKGRVRPQAGDIAIWNWAGNLSGWPDHVGFVEKIEGNTITTIEGNTGYPNGSFVGRNTFAYNDHRIVGYIRPRYGIETPSSPANEGGDGQTRHIKRHFEVEIDSLRVFSQPKGDTPYIVDTLKRGEIKNIDQSIYTNGYKWVSYVRYNGDRVYTTWQTIDGKRQFGELRDGLVDLNGKTVTDKKDEIIEKVDKDHGPYYKLKENEFLGYDGTIYVVTKKEDK